MGTTAGEAFQVSDNILIEYPIHSMATVTGHPSIDDMDSDIY